ncbi:porin [Cupriavidus basilensis]
MKKSAIVLAAGSLLAGSAFAQTSVTLYGIADVSVRYTTHADASGHGKTELTDGAVTQSRWGLKGAEALGNNLKAIFQLENGYSLDTGKLNSANTLFNRQAYVGLSGDFGAVKLGRQYTEGFNFFGDYDPLTIGNYTANAWPFFLTQFRANNVMSYGGKFGGLDVGASYGFGETAGSMTSNQYWGARAAYSYGPFGIGGVYQEIRNQAGERQQMFGAAGKYSIGPAKIFLGYLGGKDRTGAIDNGFMNQSAASITPPATAAVAAGAVNNPRKDHLGYVGTTYQATPALAVTGAFYYDYIENKNGIAGNGGHRYAGVLLAEYSLSKRTQVYGTVDYNHVSGGATTELPGANNQLGVAAGIRHIF